MRAYSVSKREAEEFVARFRGTWPAAVPLRVGKGLRVVEVGPERLLLEGEEWVAVRWRGDVVPLLRLPGLVGLFPRVVVDAGAVRFVCNGADVMRPGIRSFPVGFEAGAVVVVVEEGHGKPIAAGVALQEAGASAALTKGPVVRNVHYVGDVFWEAAKELGR